MANRLGSGTNVSKRGEPAAELSGEKCLRVHGDEVARNTRSIFEALTEIGIRLGVRFPDSPVANIQEGESALPSVNESITFARVTLGDSLALANDILNRL